MPFGLERLGGGVRQLQLGAGADDDELRGAAGRLAQDIAAARDAGACRGRRLGQGRQLLPGEGQGDRAVPSLERERPRSDRLVGVARPDEPQVRDRPQGRVVLDRLVGRTVLAQADRVVGPDVR